MKVLFLLYVWGASLCQKCQGYFVISLKIIIIIKPISQLMITEGNYKPFLITTFLALCRSLLRLLMQAGTNTFAYISCLVAFTTLLHISAQTPTYSMVLRDLSYFSPVPPTPLKAYQEWCGPRLSSSKTSQPRRCCWTSISLEERKWKCIISDSQQEILISQQLVLSESTTLNSLQSVPHQNVLCMSVHLGVYPRGITKPFLTTWPG